MERHFGSAGIPRVECINERIGKYRVRWDIQPDTKNDDLPGGVSFYEVEFQHKPSLEKINIAVLGCVSFLTVEEVAEMGNILGEDSFAVAKNVLIGAINRYDTSDAVNEFILDGRAMWLDKATRVGLANSIRIEQEAGKETTILWFNGVRYEIPIQIALDMLTALELYALDCYNVTQAHIAAVNKLEVLEALKSYNYTAEYPPKLNFSLKK